MYTCPRCLPYDPAFTQASGPCPRCGEGRILWPGRFVPEAQPLAEGGYARVFLARDAEGREGVLKLGRATEGHEAAARALRTEAEVLASLPMVPGLPALLERVEVAGSDGPILGLVLSRIPGVALGTLLEEGLRPDVLLPVVRALTCLLVSLGAAPGGPLHHLDLKPGNVLVSREGGAMQVGLIDFGSARTTDGERGVTHAWAAPELRRSRGAALVSPEAADIWSLGLLLYTGLSGRHPVDPDGPPPVEALPLPDLHRLPEELQPIVAACLNLSPALRPRLVDLIARLDGIALPSPTILDGRLAAPDAWRVSTVDIDGYGVLVVDGVLTDEPGDGAPFDAAVLAEGLAPWLADACAPDPDTRWTPGIGPASAAPSVAWGRDLVCALGLGPDGGAVALLRHRPTLAVLPPDPDDPVALAWQRRSGAADAEEAIDRLLASEAADWTEVARVSLARGRMMVFPGLLFHRWAPGAVERQVLRFSLSLAA